MEVTALEAVLQETPVVVCPLNTTRASGDQVGLNANLTVDLSTDLIIDLTIDLTVPVVR